jgi:hypothetical protein
MRKEDAYQISNTLFRNAIKTSKNIHEALKKMGMNARGAAYKSFKHRCKNLNIDLSHFTKDKDLRKTISEEMIREVCKESISRQESLKRLGLNPHISSNTSWIKRKIKIFNITTTHWLGEGHLKNRTHNWTESIPLDKILIQNSSYLWNAALKKKLLKANLLKYECSRCHISEWLGEKLSLQLEHKNGDHTDNRIENLCLLCPNCHSLTPTFAGKNIGKSK